jgi:hypothetical protein
LGKVKVAGLLVPRQGGQAESLELPLLNGDRPKAAWLLCRAAGEVLAQPPPTLLGPFFSAPRAAEQGVVVVLFLVQQHPSFFLPFMT